MAAVAILLAKVAWPESAGDQTPWAFVFNGHNGPGDSMLVLRICRDDDCSNGEEDTDRSPSLLVIHMQSKKREASNQHAASWERIQEEASKIHIYNNGIHQIHGDATARVQQLMIYVTDERLPLQTSGKRRAAGLGSQQMYLAGGPAEPSTTSSAEPGNELQQLERGEAVMADNGLLVFAVFHNTQWHLRGAVQKLKDLLEQSTRKMLEIEAKRLSSARL